MSFLSKHRLSCMDFHLLKTSSGVTLGTIALEKCCQKGGLLFPLFHHPSTMIEYIKRRCTAVQTETHRRCSGGCLCRSKITRQYQYPSQCYKPTNKCLEYDVQRNVRFLTHRLRHLFEVYTRDSCMKQHG